MAKFRTVHLLIDRGAGVTIPREAFEFEVPILEAMHGAMGSGLVQETGAGELEVPDDAVDMLYETMRNRYSGKVGEESLAAAYRNERDFAKAVEASIVRPAKAPKVGKAPKEDEAGDGPQD